MMRRHHHRWMASLLALIASVLLYSACELTASCATIGCPQGQTCNEQTGDCQAPSIFDCTDSDTSCDAGEQCDPESGVCRPVGASCRDDSDQSCPPGQSCNTATGFCEAILNCDVDPCTSPAETCDQVTNRCVPKPCDNDADCGDSHYCADVGECRSGCRPDESNCPDGQFCRVTDDDTIGQCTEECSSDSECPVGQRCERSGEGSTCIIQSCESDSECRGEAACRGEFCVPPPCTSDGDCGEDEFCDVATGQCLGGSCDDDTNAPNHRFEEATGVETRRDLPAILCPGRPDWYAIDLRSSDTFSLRLEHAPDVDLDAYVYAEDRELIAHNQHTGSVSRISVISKKRQTVYVEIRAQNDESAPYGIRFEQNPGIQCNDDADEENDTRSEAADLATNPDLPTELSLAICGADEDWFALRDLNANSGLAIQQRDAESHIQTDLLAPDGQIWSLRSDQSDGVQSLRIRRLGVDGDYFIRLHSIQNRSDEDLRLSVEVTSPLECASSQAHNTIESAVSQSAGPPVLYSLCPLEAGWDVDWIRLDSPQTPMNLYLQLSSSIGLPPLNVDLFRRVDETAEPVRRAVTEDNIYEVRVPIEPTDAFFLRLSADGEPGRIVDRVDYQVFYRFEPR